MHSGDGESCGGSRTMCQGLMRTTLSGYRRCSCAYGLCMAQLPTINPQPTRPFLAHKLRRLHLAIFRFAESRRDPLWLNKAPTGLLFCTRNGGHEGMVFLQEFVEFGLVGGDFGGELFGRGILGGLGL